MTLYDRAVVSAGQWGLVLLHVQWVGPGYMLVITDGPDRGVYIHPDDADPSPCKP